MKTTSGKEAKSLTSHHESDAKDGLLRMDNVNVGKSATFSGILFQSDVAGWTKSIDPASSGVAVAAMSLLGTIIT